MASCSKDRHNTANNALTEKQIGRLKCVNRSCKHGDSLVDVPLIVCRYYRINYKPGKLVCLTCLKKCMNHYKSLEKKMLDGECILDGHFQNYDMHYVIESSDEDDGDDNDGAKQKKRLSAGNETVFSQDSANTLVEDSSLDQDIVDSITVLVKSVIDKNKSILKNQYELCDEFVKNRLSACKTSRDEVDGIINQLSNDLKSIKSLLYDPYKPILEDGGTVDINDSENARVQNLMEVEQSEEDGNILDKEDVIAVHSSIYTVPADLPKEGELKYPQIRVGQFVYALKLTLLHPWSLCKIKSVVNDDYVHIEFESEQCEGRLLTTKEIAYFMQSPVQFPVGSRVISKFSDVNSTITDAFYAGVIAERPNLLNNFRYLIFFDDGYVQYQQHKNIRLIVHKSNSIWNDVHPDFKDFIRNYLDKYPERQMVRLTNKHYIRAAYDNKWQYAKVLDVDASLVKLYFKDLKICEWLYRGSSRLYNIYEKQSKFKQGIRCRQSGLAYLNKPFVEYTSVEEPVTASKCVARKSTNTSRSSVTTHNDGSLKHINKCNAFEVFVPVLPQNRFRPKLFVDHSCNNSCIDWTEYNYNKTTSIGMLATPIYYGFDRVLVEFNATQKCVWYTAPCGRTIKSIKEMHDYLIVTKSTMTIDQFDFNNWVKVMNEFKVVKPLKFVLDITDGKEFRVISCVNTINNKLPPRMDYMTIRQPMPGVSINLDPNFLCGCDCTDNCEDKSKCACWKLTVDGQNILPNLYKDPNIGYNYRRLPERVLTGIYECNATCKCSSSCLNRVVQNPLSQKLQLFLTEKKGWGVRCLNDIPQGSFICIYVGCLLTETDANEGGKNYGDEYLAELDYIEVLEKIKEDYEDDVPEESDLDHDNKSDKYVAVSESSDENFQNTVESNNMISDISLRLRKRKKTKSDAKTKKDERHEHNASKLNVRNMENNPEAQKLMRGYFGKNESVYIMDAKTSGNIGRYLNHSCHPNVFVQNVFVDTHDIRFPWISFFALHYLSAGTELTWDYSYDVGSVPGKVMKCHCESAFCRGRLL